MSRRDSSSRARGGERASTQNKKTLAPPSSSTPHTLATPIITSPRRHQQYRIPVPTRRIQKRPDHPPPPPPQQHQTLFQTKSGDGRGSGALAGRAPQRLHQQRDRPAHDALLGPGRQLGLCPGGERNKQTSASAAAAAPATAAPRAPSPPPHSSSSSSIHHTTNTQQQQQQQHHRASRTRRSRPSLCRPT